jgi:hypothetical protein
MASDSMLHGLFRSLESCIHERLTMIEEVCRGRSYTEPVPKHDELLSSIQMMESRITVLESTIQDMKSKTSVSETVHVNRIGNETVESPKIWIKAMKDLEIILPPASSVHSDAEVEEMEEVEEEVEEVDEEVEEVEEEVEEVEEKDAEELEEITFKNKKYGRDSSNNIYGLDADGGLLSDEPIGVWDTERQRVLFKRT